MTITITPKQILTTTLMTACLGAPLAQAAVSAAEAAKLNTTLTPFGAERAANAEGTIPAWTGGLTKPPAGYRPGKRWPDPFADDKAQFTITAQNYRQYADKLTDGQKALFERYPDTFKMHIYPTRRPHAMPEWIYENTLKNATSAKLVEGGNGVNNAYGGVPFPIPQNGLEAIWNHLLRWQGQAYTASFDTFIVHRNGSITLAGNDVNEKYAYYAKNGSYQKFDGIAGYLLKVSTEPARRKGEIILINEPLNQIEVPRQAWQYIPGQRRVRRAPTLAYDAPAAETNGLTTFDDSLMFNGAPNRFDWILVGKQEFYVPYNDYKFISALNNGESAKTLFPAGHPNPDYRRWELHRVWVVEATLKADKRHVYAKRRFYLDEDSWAAVAAESYDGRGNLWRANFAAPVSAYQLPGVVTLGFTFHDLMANSYAVNRYGLPRYYEGEADSYYTPQNVRKLATR